MLIKAQMPNDAWLSTITGSAAAKFRVRLQLTGPFTALTAVHGAGVETRALCRAVKQTSGSSILTQIPRSLISPGHNAAGPRAVIPQRRMEHKVLMKMNDASPKRHL